MRHNDRGDLIDDGEYRYTWDAAGRLLSVTARDKSLRVSFQYDGDGRRIQTDSYQWNPDAEGAHRGDWVLYSTRKFVYEGVQLVAELDGDDNLLTTYAWGSTGLLSITDHGAAAPTVYLPQLGDTGNVVSVTDASDGSVVARYQYDPYGQLLDIPETPNACPVLWEPSLLERESGPVHLDCRHAAPTNGAFISRDPSPENAALNLYTYCENEPL